MALRKFLFGWLIMTVGGVWLLKVVWPPLLILFLVICLGSLCIEIKKGKFLFLIIAPIFSSLWGAFMALLTYFGSHYTHSPLWITVMNYVLGFFVAGYIGYRDHNTVIGMMEMNVKDYHVICQFFSILVYIGLLLGLHFLF